MLSAPACRYVGGHLHEDIGDRSLLSAIVLAAIFVGILETEASAPCLRTAKLSAILEMVT